MNSFAVDFDLKSGFSSSRKPLTRHLSEMEGMYLDYSTFSEMTAKGDPLVYSFFDLKIPEHPGDLAFGTSIVEPGKVGNEYFMTKGHFHTILETAEVYYCQAGKGVMLMESPQGDHEIQELSPGVAVYVPKSYAHRSINTSADGPLVTFFTFRADAGHNYGTIEQKGFRKLLVEEDGKPVVIDNPKWK